MYLNNNLVKPDQITLKKIPLDLGKITQSLYVVGTEQDHITPWKGTFKICQYTGGSSRYVLASSGHILGILNPPTKPPKQHFWAGDATKALDHDNWLTHQQKSEGSWWEDWRRWLSDQCGDRINPPDMGNKKYPVLAQAPGTYVLEKAQ
jgi:polyhydroxyalkanoate synthase